MRRVDAHATAKTFEGAAATLVVGRFNNAKCYFERWPPGTRRQKTMQRRHSRRNASSRWTTGWLQARLFAAWQSLFSRHPCLLNALHAQVW